MALVSTSHVLVYPDLTEEEHYRLEDLVSTVGPMYIIYAEGESYKAYKGLRGGTEQSGSADLILTLLKKVEFVLESRSITVIHPPLRLIYTESDALSTGCKNAGILADFLIVKLNSREELCKKTDEIFRSFEKII